MAYQKVNEWPVQISCRTFGENGMKCIVGLEMKKLKWQNIYLA